MSGFSRVLGGFDNPNTSLLMGSGSKSRVWVGFGYQKSRGFPPGFGYPNPSVGFSDIFLPDDEETEETFVLDELKALAMAAMATAATAFPDPGGTGIKGGGTGKCVKAWLLATEVAEDGVRLNDELSGPNAVTIGL